MKSNSPQASRLFHLQGLIEGHPAEDDKQPFTSNTINEEFLNTLLQYGWLSPVFRLFPLSGGQKGKLQETLGSELECSFPWNFGNQYRLPTHNKAECFLSS